MLRTSVIRLSVVQRHLAHKCMGSLATPKIVASPERSMTDEQVHIQLKGLPPEQLVTLVAHMAENKTMFESRCVYKANNDGVVDLLTDESLAGTYTGVDPMGLFWSVQSASGKGGEQRLVKKDVTAPLVYTIKLFHDVVEKPATVDGQHVSEATVERCYMRDGVKRIWVKDGQLRGTIFIPEGDGPFPALIDMSGSHLSVSETRACLLASHGYAVFTLAYLYMDHLPDNILDAQPNYIADAARYFLEKPYVDETRFGAIGLCYGGFQSLILASHLPQVRAVVNVGGISIYPSPMDKDYSRMPIRDTDNAIWPRVNKVYATDEGVVINEIYECPSPSIVPAWRHGAKLLFIWGDDDKQVHPKWATFYKNHMPSEYKHLAEFCCYPGAGHFIEVPYTPHCRSAKPGRIRNDDIEYMPATHKDKKLMAGGFTKAHALAQEDSWKKILAFLRRELCIRVDS